MAYYSTCPKCGCHLDPQEKCDCETEEAETQNFFNSNLKMEPTSRQLVFVFEGRGTADAEKSYC